MSADHSSNPVAPAIAKFGAALLVWLAIAWFIADYTTLTHTHHHIAEESAALDKLVASTAQAIDLSLGYLHGIPTLIAKDRNVAAAVVRMSDAARYPSEEKTRRVLWSQDPQLRLLDGYLEGVRSSLDADVAWVVNATGDCIASSNAGTQLSFVGTRFADREYFLKGREGKTARQYAVGRVTNIPGLYFSTPIKIDGRFAGVAVVKIDLAKLTHWVNQADAFISDQYGIVILAHDPTLAMRALPGSDITQMSDAERLARYKRSDFRPLEIKPWNPERFPTLRQLDDNTQPVLISGHHIKDVNLDISAIKPVVAAADFRKERLQLFMLVGVSGTLILLLVASGLVFAGIRRHAAFSRAQSSSLLRTTIESTIDGILVVDNSNRVTTYNRRFVEIWHIPSELVATAGNALDFVLTQVVDQQALQKTITEAAEHPDSSSFDTLQLKNGHYVESYSSPQRMGTRIVGRVWSFRDVTERVRNEQALRESRDQLESKVNERTADLQSANAALLNEHAHLEQLIRQLAEAHNQLLQSEKMASIGQLAAGVAHEINNPVGYVNSNLATLQGYIADLLQLLSSYERNEGQLDPETQAMVSELKRKIDLAYLRGDIDKLVNESIAGLQRVKRIVLDLKDFSHVGESTRLWANIEKGLDSTLNVVWNELKYKTEVVKEYAGIPEIECIPTQLNQVFLNLLMNAVQAIETHGKITIRTGQEGDNVWVEVEDTGCGIPPDNLSRIFDPFFTTKPVGKGTGLGLSLSYSIVQKHGGRIEVRSEIGKGTTFRVVLPIQAPAEAAEEAAVTAK